MLKLLQYFKVHKAVSHSLTHLIFKHYEAAMIIPVLQMGKLRFNFLAERRKARGDLVTVVAV